MNNNVRRITDGAMMCAIAGAFLLVNRYLGGMLEEMLLFVFPLPMVFYAAKYGIKQSWPVFAAMVLLTVVVSTPQTIFYVASESLIGMVYGGGVKRKVETRKLVWMTVIISVLCNMITMLVYASWFGYDLTAEMGMITDLFTDMEQVAGIGLSNTVDVPAFLRNILFISIILTGIMQGLATHLLSRLLLSRLRYDIRKSKPFIDYYPPLWTGYIGIAGLVAYYWTIINQLSNPALQNLVQGFGMCGVFYLLFFGMVGIVVYLISHVKGARKWAWLIALVLSFVGSLMVVLFGFLYITTGMHRRWLTEPEGDLHA